MRLGIVLAATGAAVVTAWAVAAAQEGFDGRTFRPVDPASRRTIHYFSKNGSSSQHTAAPARPNAVPGVRNYYGQLFKEQQAPAQDPNSRIHTASGAADEDSSLIHAKYDRLRGSESASEIRPVADQRTADPFGPMGPPIPAAGTTAARSRMIEAQSQAVVSEAEAQDDPFAAFTRRPQMQSAPAQTMEPEATATRDRLSSPILRTSSVEQTPAFEAAETTPSFPAFGETKSAATSLPSMTAAPEAATASQISIPQSEPTESSIPSIQLSGAEKASNRLIETNFGGPAAVEVKWERVSEITVGKECRCELVVKNSGAGAAGDVAVEAFFPPSVRLTASDPKPSANDDHLTWVIPTLAAGAEKRIAVTLIPSEQGDLQVSAYVRYTEAAATTLAVREPQLEVTLSGPEEVPVGETVSQIITISNPGSGTTDDVTVEAIIPPGLEHAKGAKLSMPIGSLSAGQSQVIRLALFATGGGPQPIQVRATSGESLRDEAASTVFVSAPTLKIVTEGPSLRYVGRDALYRIRVMNDGGAAANNVRVTHAVPDGFSFIRADKGGKYEAGPSQIVWYVGRLEAGQSVDLAAELTARNLGDHQHLVTVTSEGGAKAQAAMQTAVDGTASLVVEVLDLDDPVEVGSETAYEVRVRNEGTKPATNVEIACEVPTGVAALSARGPTAHQGDANLLTFAPIGRLDPGKTALYRVIVKGSTAGKHRFRVRLTSNSIDEPLIHEELTHYYAD